MDDLNQFQNQFITHKRETGYYFIDVGYWPLKSTSAEDNYPKLQMELIRCLGLVETTCFRLSLRLNGNLFAAMLKRSYYSKVQND